MITENVFARLNVEEGTIEGAPLTMRRLGDLKECFADQEAYAAALADGDPVLYTVASVEPANGDGQMHYGLGKLMPGKVGDEYYLTKGHLHSWRPAAEVYIGLSGDGRMLLEDENTGETRMEVLAKDTIVYVPGHTAHRTVNVGTEPLVYIGVYPAAAGHDYAPIAKKNFKMQLVDKAGIPTLIERTGK
jgi:glucose-6-phosphate isomerase